MERDPRPVPAGFRLHHLLTQNLPRHGARLAVREDDREWTYAQLHAAAEDFAAQFRASGVRGGDRIALVGENCVEMLAALFAASMLNAWAVPINARLTWFEICQILEHCAPKVVTYATTGSAAAQVHASAHCASPRQLGTLRVHFQVADAPQAEPVHAEAGEQVALLIYTSGTTGRPKGVMLTHANIGYATHASSASRRTSADDVLYAALPISHIFGLASVVLSGLSRGARIRLVAQFTAEAALRDIEGGVTIFHGVPAMYQKLLELADAGHNLAGPRLRFVHCGGAPLDESLKARVEEVFRLPVNNGYGMTEASPTICLVPYNLRTAAPTVGFPIEGLETQVLDDEGRPVDAGSVGELFIRGPNVMKGYYRDPDETRRTLVEGWLRTGDLVKVVDDFFYVMGRKKELIIRSGFNVYPAEVEAAIAAHPSVRACCVVGVRRGGDEAVVAFIEPHCETVAAETLGEHLALRLAAYKRPQHLLFTSCLPTTSSGKVRRGEVEQMARHALGEGQAPSNTDPKTETI